MLLPLPLSLNEPPDDMVNSFKSRLGFLSMIVFYKQLAKHIFTNNILNLYFRKANIDA